jgi:hypothetical protein
MKYTSLVIALSLLLFGCSRRDAQLQKQVVGSWKTQGASVTSFDSRGTFKVSFPAHTNQLTQGTWFVKDGAIVITITKSTQIRSGITDRLKIVRVDSGQLLVVDEVNGHTNLLAR